MTLPESLTLLKTHSLQTLVQEQLERMILDGQFAPGEPLREAALSGLLPVLRKPSLLKASGVTFAARLCLEGRFQK